MIHMTLHNDRIPTAKARKTTSETKVGKGKDAKLAGAAASDEIAVTLGCG